jgi:DNA-binding MarR family transcriptional regulator
MKGGTLLDRDKAKAEAWKRFKDSQQWVANAPMPVISRIQQVAKLARQRFEDEFKISMPQMRVLFEAQQPDGVSQAEICRNYELEPAALTRTVQAMERDGLITRASDKQDNRLMRVFTTEKGRQLTDGLPQHIAAFERDMLAGWTDEEVLELHRLLEKIETRLSTTK